MKNKVVVRLTGGLGNQLHQYAYASILAKLLSAELFIDKEFLTTHSKKLNITLRDLELNKFKIIHNYYKSIISSQLFLSVIKRFKFIKFFLNLFGVNIVSSYIPIGNLVSKKSKLIYLDGIIGNYIDYENHESFLMNLFIISNDFEDLLNSVESQIETSNETVAIHIRRTDYLKEGSIHCVLPMEYYEEGIKFIDKNIKNPKFYIFSDDIEFVKQNFIIDNQRFFCLDYSSNEAAFFDFLAIKKCKHHILANSTFSWWASFLGDTVDSLAVAPSSFLKTESLNLNETYPKKWTII